MHRILKSMGSIFLHCDGYADAYIRVEILDKIFGVNNFRSHIVWRRTTAHGNAKQGSKQFETNFDSIYFYSKSDKFIFKSVMPFRDAIKPMSPTSSERIGCPTQKPQKLLARIIKYSTNEGDIVLYPFVGGGTTIAVADKLNPRWIGIDKSVQPTKVTEFRANLQQDFLSQPFVTQLHKYADDSMRYSELTFIATAPKALQILSFMLGTLLIKRIEDLNHKY